MVTVVFSLLLCCGVAQGLSIAPPEPAAGMPSSCFDLPLDIGLTVDSSRIAAGATVTVEARATARAPLRRLQMVASAEGGARLVRPASTQADSAAAGEALAMTFPVQFTGEAVAWIAIDVDAETTSGFRFGKREILHVRLHEGEVLLSRGHPLDLQIEALQRDRLAGRVSDEAYETRLAALLRPDGDFDSQTEPWMTGAESRPEGPFGPPTDDGGEVARAEAVEASTDSPLRGGVSFRVMGNVRWTGDDGLTHPAYGVTVQVRDDDTVGSELIWSSTTDGWGNYDTGFISHDDGVGQGNPDIFVRLRLANGAVDVRDDCFGCTTYETNSGVTNEFSGGTITQNFTFAQTGTGPAASVLTGLTWSALYAHDLNGGAWLSSIYAHWPGDPASSNYWCGSSCRINVQPGDAFDWDVLHHEYGHKVMDDFNFDNNPGGAHNIDACHAVVRGSKDVGIRLAWGEGWPTFFGTAGQHALNLAALGVPRVGDVDYTETDEAWFTYSLEENSGGPPWSAVNGSGEDSELAVQRLLWDLYDTPADSRDTVSMTDDWLFSAISGAHAATLSDTWLTVRSLLSAQVRLAWGAVMTDHNIGPRPLAPAGGTVVTPASATFFWDAHVGCDPAFAGNLFELTFYHPVTFATVLAVPGLTTTSYTLSPGQFQALVAAGHDVLWGVRGWNTASPATGDYLGDTLLIHAYIPPMNDACTSATAIADGTTSGTTLGATADGNDSCVINSGSDVWYAYEATCDGFLRVDTCGSSFSTVLSIHDGCPGNFLNQWACDRNCDGDPCGYGNSCVGGTDVPVSIGDDLLIRVAGVAGAAGDFSLHVSCDAQHDACEDAGALVNGSSDDGTTVGAAWDNAPTCDGIDNTAAGVWYTVIGNGNVLTASLCNDAGNYDAKLSVYCGGCEGLQCRGASDDACGVLPEVSWCSTPGAVHHVLVHGWQLNEGDFRITVSDGAYCGPLYLNCAPGNDNCVRATEIAPGSFTADNTNATTDGAATCAATSRDVWFRFTPVCHGFATFSTCGAGGSLADTVLSVHDGCTGRELACNDDFAGCGARSQVTVPVEADRPILLRAASYGGSAQGTFPLSVSVAGSIAPLALPWPGLYVADGGGALSDYLWRIEADGTLTPVGPLGLSGIAALAWARPLGLMYGVNDSIDVDQMATLDWSSGAATPFGNVGFSAVQALAFDPVNLVLYGADLSSGNLLRIDPFTGAGRVVGPIGAGAVTGLAMDPATGVLYGADAGADQLVTINTATGAGAVVGSFGGGFNNIKDIAFDPLTGVLYGVQNDSIDGRLVQIDKATGTATLLSGPYDDLNPQALTAVAGLPDGTVGESYLGELPIGGGCPRYFVGDAVGMPPGLSVSGDGVVAGTPTTGGVYALSITVQDTNLGTPPIDAALPLHIHPQGESCAAPIDVGEGDTPFDTRGATTDGPAEPAACNFFGDTQVGSDVWFCYPSDCAGRLTISLCDSEYDTKLAVYEGCACPQSGDAVACSDDDCGTQSMLILPVAAGQDYLVRVGGYLGATGAGVLTIACEECTTTAECDDGNACTTDGCVSGRCRHDYLDCDDRDVCTLDDCEAAVGCTHMAIDCDDDDPCTLDACDPEDGCFHTPIACGGACCIGAMCIDGVDAEDCFGFVCDVWAHLPPSFAGCYGDVDGNGVVNAGDRGFISAAIGRTDDVLVCLYDMDGNGVINAGDRGFVSAAIGLCEALPDWQNGSGLNHGVPDPRFEVVTYMGAGTTCAGVVCP
jgi:hypothetical protein